MGRSSQEAQTMSAWTSPPSSSVGDYRDAIELAKAEFLDKLAKYGAAWKVQRLSSLIERVFTKVNRIRTLEELGGHGRISDTIASEFIGVFNYCVMIADKLNNGSADISEGFFELPNRWETSEQASKTYDKLVKPVWDLFQDKDHDYGAAWRSMQPSTFTDELMVRLHRIHFLEKRGVSWSDSKGPLRDQLLDMMNYALFGWILTSTEELQSIASEAVIHD
jgi:hypothetical protein